MEKRGNLMRRDEDTGQCATFFSFLVRKKMIGCSNFSNRVLSGRHLRSAMFFLLFSDGTWNLKSSSLNIIKLNELFFDYAKIQNFL